MRIWFFSFVIMAPCVFLIGIPVCLLRYSAFKEYQSFKNQNPYVDSSFSILGIGFDAAGGQEVLAGVVIASFFILFVVGVVLLFRSSILKQSESSHDEE